MEKEIKKIIMEESTLDPEEENVGIEDDEENGGLSPKEKEYIKDTFAPIMDVLTKSFSNPHAGGSINDIFKHAGESALDPEEENVEIEDDEEEDGELSPKVKDIATLIMDMLTKSFSNPHAGGTINDILKHEGEND